jgi:hypothetical protein
MIHHSSIVEVHDAWGWVHYTDVKRDSLVNSGEGMVKG